MSFKRAATRFAYASVLLVSPWLTGISHSQTLILKTALQRALAANPRLTAAERDVGIASGQSIQTRLCSRAVAAATISQDCFR